MKLTLLIIGGLAVAIFLIHKGILALIRREDRIEDECARAVIKR